MDTKKILLWLIKNGFKFTNKGVEYLADAICLYHKYPKDLITAFYSDIGGKNNVLSHSVERCIRNAIQTQWSETTFAQYTTKTQKNSEAIYLLELIYFEGDNNEK